jgi:hypothetical protein
MASDEMLLGVIADVDGDRIKVYVDGAAGTVSLEWDYGMVMMLGPGARDQLRELLDRAAMPGRPGEPDGQ